MRMIAPANAAKPMRGWKTKQIARYSGIQGRSNKATGPSSGEIGPHRIEVAQGLSTITADTGPQGQSHQRIVDAATKGFVERAADAHEDASANCIENTQGREQCPGENQKAD